MTTTAGTLTIRDHITDAELAPVGGGSRLTALNDARRALDAEVDFEVRAMREQGDSWARIGACLGTTKQAAQQKFGGLVIDSGRSRR